MKLPSMVVDEHISSGKLVNITPGWRSRSGIVHAAFPSRRGLLQSCAASSIFLQSYWAGQRAEWPKEADAKGNCKKAFHEGLSKLPMFHLQVVLLCFPQRAEAPMTEPIFRSK